MLPNETINNIEEKYNAITEKLPKFLLLITNLIESVSIVLICIKY